MSGGRTYIAKARDRTHRQEIKGQKYAYGVVLCQLGVPGGDPPEWVVWSAWIGDDGHVWGTSGGCYAGTNFLSAAQKFAEKCERYGYAPEIL